MFALVSEDDAGNPEQGTVTAQRRVDRKVAGVVGHLTSGTTIAASKIYFDAGIPQITPSATSPKYTQNGYATAFRIIADDSSLGAVTAEYATRRLGARRVAVIDDRSTYGQDVADIFANVAKQGGAAVVSRLFTSNAATDFSKILAAVKVAKPEVVFFGGYAGQAGALLRHPAASISRPASARATWSPTSSTRRTPTTPCRRSRPRW
jgi:branched-chain amino acid transport system substrate-binding protein